MPPQEPTLSYEQSCALTEFVPAAADMSHRDDARPLLVGRWELCGAEASYGSRPHAGIEFGSNGRDQLLRRQNGALVPVANGPTGEYTLLASGQFMQRGDHADSAQGMSCRPLAGLSPQDAARDAPDRLEMLVCEVSPFASRLRRISNR